jgi:hypothetical protein
MVQISMMKRVLALGVLAVLALPAASPALAQSAECQQIQTLLQQRQSLAGRLRGSKKLTPAAACSIFGQLVGNGSKTLALLESNKDWCRIPDTFVESYKADHQRSVGIRGQACRAQQQQAVMERRARQAQQQAQRNQQQGGFGGADSITGGPMRVPQGAL